MTPSTAHFIVIDVLHGFGYMRAVVAIVIETWDAFFIESNSYVSFVTCTIDAMLYFLFLILYFSPGTNSSIGISE